MSIQARRISREGCVKLEKVNVDVGFTQPAKPVTGVRRLAVLDLCPQVKMAGMPHIWRCGERQLCGAAHAGITGDVVPISAGSHKYVLLWGAGTDEESISDPGDDGYSETPLASVYRLLSAHFERELHASNPQRDESMNGGVLEQLAGGVHRSCSDTERIVRSDMAMQLTTTGRVIYVYDFCSCETHFKDLKFVNDAARNPLAKKRTDGEFKATYGIERKLTFKERECRSARARDWWSELYSDLDADYTHGCAHFY